MKGTLYPEWNQDFSFTVNRDNYRRRAQEIVLEVWGWVTLCLSVSVCMSLSLSLFGGSA